MCYAAFFPVHAYPADRSKGIFGAPWGREQISFADLMPHSQGGNESEVNENWIYCQLPIARAQLLNSLKIKAGVLVDTTSRHDKDLS
jgi:hypothetical protein